jgi:hypothetical protein
MMDRMNGNPEGKDTEEKPEGHRCGFSPPPEAFGYDKSHQQKAQKTQRSPRCRW